MQTVSDKLKEKFPDCKKSSPQGFRYCEDLRKLQPLLFGVDCIFKKRNALGKHCDDFVFYAAKHSGETLYLIERKSRSIRASTIRDQLQGGADFIQNFSAEAKLTIKFIPWLVSKSIRPAEVRALLQQKVTIGGCSMKIRRIKTGGCLPLE